MPFNRFRSNKKENRICNGKKDSNNVLIIVEDNGIGIKPEDISRIFEPNLLLKQRHGIRFRYYQNIIENYKGTITFETEYGKGTRFTVSLQ
jgi:signal transduction histidine kinase